MSRQEAEHGKAWVEDLVKRLSVENGVEVTSPFAWHFDMDHYSYWMEVELDGTRKRWQFSGEKLEDCLNDEGVQREIERLLVQYVIPRGRPSDGGAETSGQPSSIIDEQEGLGRLLDRYRKGRNEAPYTVQMLEGLHSKLGPEGKNWLLNSLWSEVSADFDRAIKGEATPHWIFPVALPFWVKFGDTAIMTRSLLGMLVPHEPSIAKAWAVHLSGFLCDALQRQYNRFAEPTIAKIEAYVGDLKFAIDAEIDQIEPQPELVSAVNRLSAIMEDKRTEPLERDLLAASNPALSSANKEPAQEDDREFPRTAGPKPKQPTFETAFHSYWSDGPVGHGGAGTVFKVHNEDGEPCAIKCLDPGKTTSERLKRFKNELVFCKNEVHPNIVRVLDEGFTIVEGKKVPFYVMPYHPKTLRRLMTDGITNAKIPRYFAQVLDGVEAAHLRGVWHRDLKPENILYDPETDALVVADFGIAHFEEEDLHTAVETRDDVRLANFQYAAPEQRARGKKVDHRADIFALGLILNEMFTHETLQGEGYKRIASVALEFEYLDNVVALMVQQESERRPASLNALKELLRARGDEYVSQQKLSALRNTVIPISEIDDPLIDNPVRVVGADYRGGKIVFTLSQAVNELWTQAFHNQIVQQFRSGLSPQDFAISGITAVVRADELLAKEALDHANRYVAGATAGYKRKLEESRRNKEESERRALRNQIEDEEKRRRILKILNRKG